MEGHQNVAPMEQRRLVTYINNFITSTVTFLNNFMAHCESKMMKSERRLQQISASLCILETKLNSVPELQELLAQQIPIVEPPVNQPIDTEQLTEATNENNKTEDNIVSGLVESTVEVESLKQPAVDPAILKYRKMLQFGVPRGAVELKMAHEGLDPKLL